MLNLRELSCNFMKIIYKKLDIFLKSYPTIFCWENNFRYLWLLFFLKNPEWHAIHRGGNYKNLSGHQKLYIVQTSLKFKVKGLNWQSLRREELLVALLFLF